MKKIINWIGEHLHIAWVLLVSILAVVACGLAMGGAAETDASVLNADMYSNIGDVHTDEA